ncbi:MAG: hypothetical protein HY815_20115 [Candidatus Riflebacteria bacterium]|nr:hypothetical protein [Candidatus Riflebacteria bacterium]
METAPAVCNCPVCACPLSGAVEVCTSCQTPHHADCARFVGRCAVFGCGAYDFMTLDAEAARVFEKDAIIEAAASGADLQIPATAPTGLNRGIISRVVAAGQLLRLNRSIALSLGAFITVFSLLPFPFPAIGFILAQAMLVILFVSRAKGKESSFRQALALANQRGGRVVLTGVASSILTIVPAAIGLMLLFGSLAGELLLLVPAILSLWLGFRLMVSYSLANVVAAMGREEEPNSALRRSAELVNVGRPQAAVSMLANIVAGGLIGIIPYYLVAIVANTAFFMVSTTYWLLFYLEARRTHEQTYLPHAPDHFLPARDRD